MAFSTTEKQTIIRLLGWPAKSLDQDSTHYNSLAVSRLTNLDEDSESQTRVLLSRVTKLDERLESALCRLQASRVDKIEMNADEVPMLRKERNRVLQEISAFLDLPMARVIGGAMGSVCV